MEHMLECIKEANMLKMKDSIHKYIDGMLGCIKDILTEMDKNDRISNFDLIEICPTCSNDIIHKKNQVFWCENCNEYLSNDDVAHKIYHYNAKSDKKKVKKTEFESCMEEIREILEELIFDEF